MFINEKMNELFNLLDKQEDIKRINLLKKEITDKEISLINIYRNNPTVENKKVLYKNKIIRDYLVSENNINFLILQINSKFKRRKNCEGNKW